MRDIFDICLIRCLSRPPTRVHRVESVDERTNPSMAVAHADDAAT